MAVDTSIVGKPTGAYKVRVERGPVSFFAAAVMDDNPIYHDPEAAQAAGFPSIPAPATFSFAMQHMGKWDEEQPADPTKGQNPMHAVMSELFGKGALILHGEQEFIYHRPIVVGDVLVGEGKILDIYERETDTAMMTFVVVETTWRDEPSNQPVVVEKFNLIGRTRKG
jgi:acyl dehydratase